MTVNIEYQDQFGTWRRYCTANNNPNDIQRMMEYALKSGLTKMKSARAVDSKTGMMVSFLTK